MKTQENIKRHIANYIAKNWKHIEKRNKLEKIAKQHNARITTECIANRWLDTNFRFTWKEENNKTFYFDMQLPDIAPF